MLECRTVLPLVVSSTHPNFSIMPIPRLHFRLPVSWRRLGTLIAVLCFWLILSWMIADRVTLSRSQRLVENERVQTDQQAQKLRESISQVVQQQHGIPQIVALNPEASHALYVLDANTTQVNTAPSKVRREQWSPQLPKTNQYLVSAAQSLRMQVVYLINTAGDCIASSNYNQPDSFIGSNFKDRPYFQTAMAGNLGTQYAFGRVSNIPGLFFSAPVKVDGRIAGVVVAKINLSNLSNYIGASDAFITDRYGVVILASENRLEMHALANSKTQELTREQRQSRYKRTEFPSLNLRDAAESGIPDLHFLSDLKKPMVISKPYSIEEDVTLHLMKYLPQLQQFENDRMGLFTLLALAGALLLAISAWRLSVLKNRRRLAKTLQESESRFHIMADSAPALIWMADTNNLGIWFNRSWLEYTGRKMEEEVGIGWMYSVHPEDMEHWAIFERQPVINQHQRFEIEYRLRRADGSYGWVADTGTPYFDLDGKFQGYISYCWDINQRKKSEEQIRHLAFYDSLTLLPNRRLLNDRLHQAINISKRDNRYGAVIFLDLDNFKPLNDRYGHAVGDLLLIDVAQRIADCIRKMDTVARFGGDEFVVLLNGLNADEEPARHEAATIADKIRRSLAAPYLLNFEQDGETLHVEHHCTSSVGVVLFLGDAVKQKDILRNADAAMYRAKESGRNNVLFYDQIYPLVEHEAS